MKLLLINSINPKKYIETVYPSLGLAYLSSKLKNHFIDLEIKIVDRQIKDEILKYSPNFVGVSSVSQNFNRAIEIGELCKSLNIPVFVGGVHITMLPMGLPDVFDFGVIGEGEKTIIEVMNYLMKDGKSGSTEMQSIKGLVLHDGDSIKITEMRPLIRNIDTIPYPERSLLNIPVGGAIHIFSSRGCPYKCTFCASARFWDQTRWFSAEYVVNEIEMLMKTYKPWVITFYDDLAVANINRLEQIVEIIVSKGIYKQVKFNFSCRANLVNENLIRILKRLNVHRVCLGLESGCQKTLSFLKPDMKVEKNSKALELLKKSEIPTQATFIIGSPDETVDDIMQTYNFIKNSKLVDFEVYILTPFPGTPIWEIAINRGLVSNKMDWEKLDVEVNKNIDDKILLSEIPKDKLMELHSLFKKEKKVRKYSYIIKQCVKNPFWGIKKIIEKLR